MKSLKISLKKGDLKIAEQFAEDRVNISMDHYERRGQKNIDKIMYDIKIGALGEIAIYRMLKKFGIKTNEPDFKIYAKKDKSYDADFTDDKGINFHCKSQSEESAAQYGNSYILQYGGNGHGHTDKLFRNCTNRDFLIPCLVSLSSQEVEIFGCYKLETIFKKHLVKMPRVKWLEYSKRAIYLEDLLKLTEAQRWSKIFKRHQKDKLAKSEE